VRTTLAILVFAAAPLTAGVAQGVTPGKNGLIYFRNFSATTGRSNDIYSIAPQLTVTGGDEADWARG
jgi:hypothetical protein